MTINNDGKTEDISNIIITNPIAFSASYFSSIFTFTFGITKFLKSGPCRVVPNEGKHGGYCECGFISLYVNITLAVLVKTLLLITFASSQPTQHDTKYTCRFSMKEGAGMWLGLNGVPQFSYVGIHSANISSFYARTQNSKNIFQALTVLSLRLGFQKTLRLIFNYPAIILTPMMTYWTIIPVSRQNSCICTNCLYNNESKHIGVSFGCTWVNFTISSLGAIAYFLLCFPVGHIMLGFIYIIVFCPLSIITLAMIQKNKSCVICNCCLIKTKFTYLNVDDFSSLTDLELSEYSSPEMIELKEIKSEDQNMPIRIWIRYLDQYFVLVVVILIIVSICICISKFGIATRNG